MNNKCDLIVGTDSVPIKLGQDDATKTLAELKVVNGDHLVVEDTSNSK